MKISANNKIKNAGLLEVTSDSDVAQDINDITTADFSTAYTSMGSSTSFVIRKTFSTGIACKYVAFAGHNLSDLSVTVTATIKVNGVSKGSATYSAGSPNWVTMVHFSEVTATSVEITFVKGAADKVTLSFLAIGDTLDSGFSFPNQSVAPAGFPINWRTRSSEIRSTVNDAAQPVANVRQQIARNTTLKLSNMNQSLIATPIWLEFLAMAYDQGVFFYKDEDGTNLADEPRSAVLAFEVDVMPPKLNRSTRALVDLSFKFLAFTGG